VLFFYFSCLGVCATRFGTLFPISFFAFEQDADRQVVKGDDATITIPELELEIPPQSQKVRLFFFFFWLSFRWNCPFFANSAIICQSGIVEHCRRCIEANS
jgi:hypothetical protein